MMRAPDYTAGIGDNSREGDLRRTADEIFAAYIVQNVTEKTSYRFRVLDYAAVSGMSPIAFQILYLMHRHGNADGTNVTITVPTLTIWLRCSESTVRRALRELEPWLETILERKGEHTYARRTISIPQDVAAKVDQMVEAYKLTAQFFARQSKKPALSPVTPLASSPVTCDTPEPSALSPVTPVDDCAVDDAQPLDGSALSPVTASPVTGDTQPYRDTPIEEKQESKEVRKGGWKSDMFEPDRPIDAVFEDVAAKAAPRPAQPKLPLVQEVGTAVALARADNLPAKSRKATPVPMTEQWMPSDTFYAWAATEFGASPAQVDRGIDFFRDHFIGKGEMKASWEAAARNWIRKDAADGKLLKPVGVRVAGAKTGAGQSEPKSNIAAVIDEAIRLGANERITTKLGRVLLTIKASNDARGKEADWLAGLSEALMDAGDIPDEILDWAAKDIRKDCKWRPEISDILTGITKRLAEWKDWHDKHELIKKIDAEWAVEKNQRTIEMWGQIGTPHPWEYEKNIDETYVLGFWLNSKNYQTSRKLMSGDDYWSQVDVKERDSLRRHYTGSFWDRGQSKNSYWQPAPVKEKSKFDKTYDGVL